MSANPEPQPNSPTPPDLSLLFAAVEALPASVAIIESGFVLYANPTWIQKFGYADPLQLQGRIPVEIISERFLSNSSTADPGWKNSTVACSAAESAHAHQNGSRTHFEIASAGFRMRGKEFQVISTHDVTLQEQDERQARESQKMEAIGRLVGGIAHDFNNLLTGMMLYCDLLMAGLRSDPRLSHHAEEIRSASKHGANLIQQLLAVARNRVPHAHSQSLNHVIAGMHELLTRLIGENIELRMDLSESLGQVQIDPGQAQQIILNLVLNSRDAMPNGGRITLQTRNGVELLPAAPNDKPRLAPCIELTVTDTGLGMDEDTRSRGLELFFTTKRHGNGLGLSTVHQIVEQHGGTVTLQSAPGRGTRVIIRLPRLEDESRLVPENLIAKRGDTQ